MEVTKSVSKCIIANHLCNLQTKTSAAKCFNFCQRRRA